MFCCLVVVCTSCSNSDVSSTDPVVAANDYFNLNVSGTQFSLSTDFNKVNAGNIYWNGYAFYVGIALGQSLAASNHKIELYFDRTGKVISVKDYSMDGNSGTYTYFNYPNFPANYFNVNIISLDEVNHKIKLEFLGNLYLNKTDLNSESIAIQGELNMSYVADLNMDPNQDPYININQIPQGCTAKFNNIVWKAFREDLDYSQSSSVFTASDPYKIETHFALNAAVGSYNFTSASTDNYIKFSKFNTTTLVYDYYNVTGFIAYSYREFHGAEMYSFIGTFGFTAVNPSNPADTVTVTDGNLKSYQYY